MGTYPAVPDEQIDQFGLEPPSSSDTTWVMLRKEMLTFWPQVYWVVSRGTADLKSDVSTVLRIIMPLNFLALEDGWGCLNKVLFCIWSSDPSFSQYDKPE